VDSNPYRAEWSFVVREGKFVGQESDTSVMNELETNMLDLDIVEGGKRISRSLRSCVRSGLAELWVPSRVSDQVLSRHLWSKTDRPNYAGL